MIKAKTTEVVFLGEHARQTGSVQQGRKCYQAGVPLANCARFSSGHCVSLLITELVKRIEC